MSGNVNSFLAIVCKTEYQMKDSFRIPHRKGSLIRKQNRNWDLPWLGREDTWERKANHGDLEWPLLTGGSMLRKTRMSHWPPSNSGLEGSGINKLHGSRISLFIFATPPSSLQIFGRDPIGMILSLGLRKNSQRARSGWERSLFPTWILNGIYNRWSTC